MAEGPRVSSELSRDLSLFHITMMGLGMMIGAGIFMCMGTSIADAGPGGTVLTFAFGGVVAIFTAMSYAELSSAIPRAGGAYNFARLAFGRGPSFVAGWIEWFASSAAGSVYAVCFATYTLRFCTQLKLLPETPDYVEKAVTLGIAAVFIYINYRGASETGKAGAFMTVAQTLFLVFIGVVGLWTVVREPERLQNFEPFLGKGSNGNHGGWLAILGTMGLTAVAYEGYEVIAQAGDEAVKPRQNIPKAMLYSVCIVAITYVVVSFTTVIAVKAGPGMPDPCAWIGEQKQEGFGAAIGVLMPGTGNYLITMAVIFASTSALNATIYSATRASYALGRDRMLPGLLARISRRRKTPWVALAATAVVVLGLPLLVKDPTDLTAVASIMFLALFFLVNACVIRIRRNMGDELQYGYLMPLFPLFPVLAILCQALLMLFLHKMSPLAWIVAPAWILAGILIYTFYSRRHAIRSDDEILVFEEAPAPVKGGQCSMMVAVANLDNALSMVRTTYSLCGAMDARVELLHMVPVPDQVPLSDADRYMIEGKEAIVETSLYLAPLFPLSSTIRYCRNVARGIVSAVREKNTDLLIMGWHGRTGGSSFSMGSTIDPVLELAPCDTLIMKDCGDRKYRNILVPVAGGHNAALALRIAGILADRNDGAVTAFTVVADDSTAKFDPRSIINAHRQQLPTERIKVKITQAANPAAAVIEEINNPAEDYDLLVIGCSREPFIRKVGRRGLPDTVARRCSKPVIMVNARGGISSWIKKWI